MRGKAAPGHDRVICDIVTSIPKPQRKPQRTPQGLSVAEFLYLW
jgi:hypothetical protein